MRNNRKGFTLVELIVVIIIVGILAAVSMPMMSANVNRAKRTEAVAALGSIRTAAKLYQVESTSGILPGAMVDLNAYFGSNDLNGTYYRPGNYTFTATGVVTAGDIGFGTASINLNTGVITES